MGSSSKFYRRIGELLESWSALLMPASAPCRVIFSSVTLVPICPWSPDCDILLAFLGFIKQCVGIEVWAGIVNFKLKMVCGKDFHRSLRRHLGQTDIFLEKSRFPDFPHRNIVQPNLFNICRYLARCIQMNTHHSQTRNKMQQQSTNHEKPFREQFVGGKGRGGAVLKFNSTNPRPLHRGGLCQCICLCQWIFCVN